MLACHNTNLSHQVNQNKTARKTRIKVSKHEQHPEGMVDKIIEKITGIKGIIAIIEIGTGQGKELLQGIMVIAEIEALAMIDLDQGPEPVQIGKE